MFTGIVEASGEIIGLKKSGSNLLLTIRSSISKKLKVDQSVSHNGACLTVVNVKNNTHEVIAIDETLKKTNLGFLQKGDSVNLERSLTMNSFLDGHLVHGHVDTTAICKKIENKNGSRIFTFTHPANKNFITIEKGSVCVNGVSLTIVDCGKSFFSVAIIPYTFENTNFRFIKEKNKVNVEFDIIGKYVERVLGKQ